MAASPGISGRSISWSTPRMRAWGERFMDNDQVNAQPLIPANATIDFKLSGAYRALLLVAEREQSASTRCITTTRSRAPSRRPLQRLSAAGPNLHGEGRRDLLTPEGWRGALSGPACPNRTVFSRRCLGEYWPAHETTVPSETGNSAVALHHEGRFGAITRLLRPKRPPSGIRSMLEEATNRRDGRRRGSRGTR